MLISNSIYSSQTISNSNRHEVSEDYRNNDDQINQLLENPPSLKNNVKLREAVAETATSNKEQEIADSLLGAIDDHTIQLEAISNWTEGGLSAFKGALEMIAQNMLNNPPKNGEYGSYYEDLFQLVLMDVLANAEDYGFSQDQKFMQFLAWGLNILELDSIAHGWKIYLILILLAMEQNQEAMIMMVIRKTILPK